ncbi:MAG: glycosyltransferase [Ruminococcaceae bacterium]|nr:glycosyltransferase [Oscillospiraceae bacterium]
MGELVSVVVPVYNAERFLKPCIESILSQTYKNIELVLVDDGSTDTSADICKEFAKADSRVCYLQSPHGGVSIARNTGIQKATGQYICFVDSDDLWEPDFVETLLAEAHQSNAQVVFCNYQYLYGEKKLKKKIRLGVGKYTFTDVSHIAIDDGTVTGILFGSVWGALYSLDIIRKYNISFDSSVKRNEDGLFNLCLLPHATAFSVVAYDGYLYRQWKKNKKKDLEIDTEVQKATERIKDCCADFNDLEKQLCCRYVSAVFWNANHAAGTANSFFRICAFLKKLLAEYPIGDHYDSLNFEKINKAKKTLITMLKKKQVFLFVFSLKYMYPILKSVVKR